MPDLAFIIIDMALLLLVMLCAVATVEVRSLFSATMLSGIYSLLMAVVWVNMDAVDVAFTEAAVGAGISTILLVGTLVLVGPHETVLKRIHWPALGLVILVGAALIYGTLDMPHFGDPNSPATKHHLTRGFIEQDVAKSPTGKSGQEAAARHEHAEAEHDEHGEHAHDEHGDYFHGHVPNQVTAVIVSYRAFDTMFECCVILTAGLGMILLLRGRRGNPLKGGLL
jgi:multicomponent Na+:H+ antiporter subunit B